MRDTTLGDDRGVSTAGTAALGFGLTVLMVAAAGGLLLQTGDSLSDGGPLVSTSTDPVYEGSGADRQWGAGDVLAFRIADRRVALETGQTVKATIYHTESETELAQRTTTVVD